MIKRTKQKGEQPRAAVERPISLRFHRLGEFLAETTADISSGGMFICTESPHPVASIFEFELRPDDDMPVIRGKAQVAWVRSRAEGTGRPAGMGARFVELDEAGRQILERLVSGQLHEAADDLRRQAIEVHLKTLKLPAFARSYEALALKAKDKEWDFEDYLRELLEAEIASRHESAAARMLRSANFPEQKTLAEIDWSEMRGVSKLEVAKLARCHFIEEKEDVVLCGPIGTGKTHLAIALGIEATQRRFRVVFRRVANLVRELTEARDERELGNLQRRLERADLLICDELGFTRLDEAGAELLFHVLADRAGRRSTLITSDLPPSDWNQVFASPRQAAALADRLGNGTHVLRLTGPSYRGR